MYFEHCPATDMQNGDEASPSIIFAGQALLIKMLINLELRGIFCSNSVYYCILTLSNCLYANTDEASPSINLASQTFSRHFHSILHSSVKNELLHMIMIFIYNVYIMPEFI